MQTVCHLCLSLHPALCHTNIHTRSLKGTLMTRNTSNSDKGRKVNGHLTGQNAFISFVSSLKALVCRRGEERFNIFLMTEGQSQGDRIEGQLQPLTKSTFAFICSRWESSWDKTKSRNMKRPSNISKNMGLKRDENGSITFFYFFNAYIGICDPRPCYTHKCLL